MPKLDKKERASLVLSIMARLRKIKDQHILDRWMMGRDLVKLFETHNEQVELGSVDWGRAVKLSPADLIVMRQNIRFYNTISLKLARQFADAGLPWRSLAYIMMLPESDVIVNVTKYVLGTPTLRSSSQVRKYLAAEYGLAVNVRIPSDLHRCRTKICEQGVKLISLLEGASIRLREADAAGITGRNVVDIAAIENVARELQSKLETVVQDARSYQRTRLSAG